MGVKANLTAAMPLLPDFLLAFFPKEWISYHFIYSSTLGQSP